MGERQCCKNHLTFKIRLLRATEKPQFTRFLGFRKKGLQQSEKNFPHPLDKTVSTVYNINIQFDQTNYPSGRRGYRKVTILIDNRSGAPIYDQIYNQIKGQIISGALKENEMLPSIRGLAKDLKISFVTTKRAYDELEKEGFIYTVQAKGCYVAPKNMELLREENLKKIEEHIEEIMRLAAYCNLSKKDVADMVNFAMEENG